MAKGDRPFFSDSQDPAYRAGEIGSIDLMKRMAQDELGYDSFEATMFGAFATSERERFEQDFGS